MSTRTARAIRIFLVTLFALFVIGAIWFAIVQTKSNKQADSQTSTPTPLVVSTPVPATTPAPSTAQTNNPATASNTVKKQVLQKRVVTHKRIITTYTEVTESTSAKAWARAGVNPDGSTYAETGTN